MFIRPLFVIGREGWVDFILHKFFAEEPHDERDGSQDQIEGDGADHIEHKISDVARDDHYDSEDGEKEFGLKEEEPNEQHLCGQEDDPRRWVVFCEPKSYEGYQNDQKHKKKSNLLWLISYFFHQSKGNSFIQLSSA
jgi:hypothetical protein